MPKAKRSSLSLSKEEAAFFQECHKETAARSIGASVKETILNLRKQVEENKRAEDPSLHPFSGEPLSKRELAYIQYIQKTKSFQTVREAFAYFQGRIEGAMEKRLSAEALEPEAPTEPSEVAETTVPIKIGGQQCNFYTFNPKKQLVECMRKYATKNEICPVTQQICDNCWALGWYKKYQVTNPDATGEDNAESSANQ